MTPAQYVTIHLCKRLLQGTIAAFGDRILSSAEEIGRCYSRFREQALRIRKGTRRTIETFVLRPGFETPG
jgi:hypothetical protein